MEFKDLLVDHDYYCSDSSYFGLGFETKYGTCTEFYDDMGEADIDMNLVFRFDIKNKDSEGYYMEVFMIHQRKGRFVPFFIETVTEDDFDLIMKFLKPRYEKIQSLWSPFSTTSK